MFKFIHAADIHLDSAREGVHREMNSPAMEIQHAPRRAFQNLVRLAIEERVAFVLIAGDLYDGNWPDFHTGLFFLEQAAKLNDAGIRIFLIAGNHDAANHMTRTLMLPAGDRVKMFDARSPETLVLDDLRVALHGQSFLNRAVISDLAQGFPAAMSGWFNIGLLHTCATYAGGEHDRYAPCSVETLLSKRYDYWALGHIHKRQDLRRSEDEPPIMFPGNLQGRTVRETGAKGCVLVTVDDDHGVDVQFRAVDVLRWEVCRVDVQMAKQPDDVVQNVAQSLAGLIDASDNRPLAVRIELEGACPAHRQLVAEPNRWSAEIQAAALHLGSDRLWIERVVRKTSMPSSKGPAADIEGPVGELCEFIAEMQSDKQSLEMLSETLRPLLSRLPAELTEGPTSLGLDSEERLRELLDDARQLLIQRIHVAGESA
jgi:DNA repair exonuclease SbcCD nuclease subunit